MEEEGLYELLLEGVSTRTGIPLVVPFEPDESYLVWKIEGREGIEGDRMPLNASLSESDAAMVREWIAGGALE